VKDISRSFKMFQIVQADWRLFKYVGPNAMNETTQTELLCPSACKLIQGEGRFVIGFHISP
jgi:hypothetical protein